MNRTKTLIPAAIEEMVRLESPAQALPRTAMRDVDLHGVTIPEGARVLGLTGSGRAFCAGQDLSDRAVAPGGAPTLTMLADPVEQRALEANIVSQPL